MKSKTCWTRLSVESQLVGTAVVESETFKGNTQCLLIIHTSAQKCTTKNNNNKNNNNERENKIKQTYRHQSNESERHKGKGGGGGGLKEMRTKM